MTELQLPESFPLSAATVPLEETKAGDFLRANPTFDGRGITIGILDTGVDPGAIGLQRTSDGRPKVIDIIDCTGSGDVDMKHEAIADADGHLTGLSGRILTVPAEWQERNPSGKYRLGVKRAFELYPSGLRKRIKAERLRDFEERQRTLQLALQRAKDRLDGSKADGKQGGGTSGDKAVTDPDETEMDALLTQIAALRKDYDDPGPIFDCLAFVDGDGGSEDGHWVGAIDTTETGHFGYDNTTANTMPTRGKTPTVAPVPLMSAYGVSQQYASFGAFEQLNYGLQFYFDDGGDVMSIVVDSGAHGTHVAGITAAYHADCLEQNGVAPGAQLVSLKIGDSRLDGMETGAGLARALNEARRLGLDIINMSFGEPGAVANRGRFVELARELVRDDGVIFVSSAGNNGPALSSVGSPGGTSDCCISVGAYVSQQMMAAQYSVRRAGRPAEQLYNWSSVGPTCDGALGVEICAPGGAIAPVPNWTLNRHQLMNGTSMSSPNATGCIALLLSALKQCGGAATGPYGDRTWTPYSVRRALQTTCRAPVGEGVGARGLEPFVYGGGLVQIDAAYEHHLAHFSADGNGETKQSSERMAVPIAYDTVFHARHDGCFDGKGSRGCYLRQPEEVATPSQHLVSVTPAFHRDEPSANKVRFECAVTLQATAPWLSCPAHVLIMQQGRGFTVGVDPRGLAPGVHYGEVRGLDSSNLEAGAMFQVPFTVVKHEAWSANSGATGGCDVAAHTHTYKVKRFVPGERDRHFLAVPTGATWCDVTIEGAGGVAGAGGGSGLAIDNQLSVADGATALPALPSPPPAVTKAAGAYGDAFTADSDPEGSVVATSDADADNDSRMMLLHCVQNRAQVESARNEGFKRYIRVRPGSSNTFSFRVDGGLCLEVCLAQWWQTAGSALCRMRVAFHGVQAEGNGCLAIAGGDGYQRVVLRAPLRPTTVRPSAKLTSWRQRLRPASWTLRALGARDALPRGRQVHEIVLTYDFTQKDKGEVTPRLPLLNGALYESAFEGQMYHVYDDRKKLISVGECWPGSDNGPIKVPKALASSSGKFTVRWQIRHESRELLERYKDAVVLLERKLDSAVPIKFCASRGQIATGEGSFSDLTLTPGASVAVFLAEPLGLKPPTGASAGDELIGTVTWAKPSGDLAAGTGHAPGGFPVRYVLPPPALEAPAKKTKKAAAKPKTLSEKTRDLHLEALVALEGKAPTKHSAAATGSGEDALSQLDTAAATYDTLYATLTASFPRHLPLLRSKLRHTAALVSAGGGSNALTTTDVVAAAEAVVAKIDIAALAAFFGLRKHDADWSDLGSAADDSDNQKQATERAEKVEQRHALVEAFALKTAALETAASTSAAEGNVTPELLAAWRQLQEWADVSEPRFAKLALAMLKRGGSGSPRRGQLLKRLGVLIDTAPLSLTQANNPLGLSLTYEQVVLMRIAVLEELGWDHWATHFRAWRVVNSPASLALF